MKYVCLGYMDETKWAAMTEEERNHGIDECFSYDDELRHNGNMVGGEALQEVRNGATVTFKNGKVSVTDGPFVETKEQLGGIMFLEARDLNHAIQLLSKHPGIRIGSSFEIRPVANLSEMIAESEKRRAVKTK
jgi:hypothetical protein